MGGGVLGRLADGLLQIFGTAMIVAGGLASQGRLNQVLHGRIDLGGTFRRLGDQASKTGSMAANNAAPRDETRKKPLASVPPPIPLVVAETKKRRTSLHPSCC